MISVHKRLVVFVSVTVVWFAVLLTWGDAHQADDFPRPSVVRDTWYGWLLLLSIPLALIWASSAATRLLWRAIGIATGMLLFVLLAAAIWYVRTTPVPTF